MVDSAITLVSIPFAIVAITAAGVLGVLSWIRLRSSPFGAAVAVLSLSMGLAAAYHVVALATPRSVLLETLRSATYTSLVAFVLLTAVTHRRLQRTERVDRR